MNFKERMNAARKRLEQQPAVVATKQTKTRMTDYEYCKSIVDLAIVKIKERSVMHDNQTI